MPEHYLEGRIEAATSGAVQQRVAEYLAATCWPGGGQDRTLPAAAAWASTWRPERAAIDLLTCGCASGRCRICN